MLRVSNEAVAKPRTWPWAVLAMSVAALPWTPAFFGHRIFYIRDLSLFFWGRFLWLRRTLWSGDWPLWDSYLGAGQSAAADALHQMFLLPVLLLRMIGSERIGFNLWVAMPFPLAAVGAWGFLSRRASPPGAAIGAMAFALAGPVVSSGNFPNMSWSVASIPWVFWAVDAAMHDTTMRRVGLVALAVAFQALAGEPVTLVATLATVTPFAALVAAPSHRTISARLRPFSSVCGGILLGMLVAAIQLLPMAEASAEAQRSVAIVKGVSKGMWSLRPMALLEVVTPHLFGDYYRAQSLAEVPWMPALNSGREPFFFSIYLGVPLIVLAGFGLLANADRSWTRFWVLSGAAALVGAFGFYTPIYPFLSAHLPLLGSFRFPVKYLVVFCLAVAAAAAAGWDALALARSGTPSNRIHRARVVSVGFALAIAVGAAAVAAACLYFQGTAAYRILSFAQWVGVRDPVNAVRYMLRDLPQLASILMLTSLASATFLYFATRTDDRLRSPAATLLFVLIVGDLLVRAWGVNPSFDLSNLGEPQWLASTSGDPDARFYIGGKRDGTLDPTDMDSSPAFKNPPGLVGSASRAALSAQAAFFPAAWHRREIISYDLPILWPKWFQNTIDVFLEEATRAERDRFLERTGARYRILPDRLAAGHPPIVPIPYFVDSSLYDWGADAVTPRVNVVGTVTVVPRIADQTRRLFEEGWDARTTAIVEREPDPAGAAAAPVAPFARITRETSNRLAVEAGAGSGGGYLVVRDTFGDGWNARVDDQPAPIVRTDAIFRGVRLTPGVHAVEMFYRPPAFLAGLAVSSVALLFMLGLLIGRWPLFGRM